MSLLAPREVLILWLLLTVPGKSFLFSICAQALFFRVELLLLMVCGSLFKLCYLRVICCLAIFNFSA